MPKLKRKALHLNSSLTTNTVITNKSIYGANHIVVEGAGSIICDTVMNDIYYMKEEVVALANRTNGDIHAPSGHPMDEKGNFISAGHPMATQQNFIGGISNNYRIKDDRLVRDIAINPEIANRSDDGKEIIRRIDNKEDSDTSTGLLLSLEEKSGIGNDGEPYKWIARNMELDHDAILLRERGAATSLQGVGMFANSKGDEFGVDEYTINSSMPAMNLPLAPSDHVWNESKALSRIKDFTNSTDKPSSNFRRFFLNFDQSNVDSFDSYTGLFADIIDGVPHAVKSPIESAVNNDNAEKYNQRFASNSSFKNSLSDRLNRLFAWALNKGYTDVKIQDDNYMITNGAKLSARLKSLLDEKSGGDNEKRSQLIDDMASSAGISRDTILAILAEDIDIPPDNRLRGFAKVLGVSFESLKSLVPKLETNGDRIMRKRLIEALNAKNVKTEGLDDDAIFAAYNKLHKDDEGLTEEEILKRKKKKDDDMKSKHNVLTIEDVTTAVNAAIKPLQKQLTANADKELNDLAKQVGDMKKGITEEVAKNMGVTACNNFLAANGLAVFNTGGGQYRHNNKSEGCSSLTLPTSAKGE